MIVHIVELVASFAPMWVYALTHFMCLAFVATVPVIVRKLVGQYV